MTALKPSYGSFQMKLAKRILEEKKVFYVIYLLLEKVQLLHFIHQNYFHIIHKENKLYLAHINDLVSSI